MRSIRPDFPWIRFISLVVGILALDYLTKQLASAYFSSGAVPPDNISLFSDFLSGIRCDITLVKNRGAAWGIFSNYPTVLVWFRVFFVSFLSYLILFHTEMPFILPLGGILAGAIGNIIDYFLYGYVIDMIHFTFWGYNYPVFNIADTSICLSSAWILVLLVRYRNKT